MTDIPDGKPLPAGAARRRFARESGYGWVAVDQNGRRYDVLDISAGGLRLAAHEAVPLPFDDQLSLDLIGMDDQDHENGIACRVIRAQPHELALAFMEDRPDLAEAHRRSLARLARTALGLS